MLTCGTSTTADLLSEVNKNAQYREALEALYKAQGYNNTFFFADGFTYTESNDVGIYEDGTAWTYADAGALPVTIAAGTVPSEGVYKGVKVKASCVKDDDGTNAQDFMNKYRAALLGDEGRKYRIVAGVLRNNAGTWEFLEDAAHTNAGGLSVEMKDAVTLQLNYNFTATKVISLIVGNDESYSRLGLNVGASVGQSSADIRAHIPMEYELTTNGSGTPILSAKPEIVNRITAARSGFGMRITHAGAVINDGPQVTAIGDSPSVELDNLTATGMNLNQYTNTNYWYRLRYSSGWILTSNDPLSALDSSGFLSSGDLVITTSTEDEYFNTSTSHRYSEARLYSNAPGSMTIRFYDDSGVTIKTEANATMECSISRGAAKKVGHNSTTLLDGSYSVRRGMIPIYWDELTASPSTGGNGNLWVLGVFEV